MTTDRQLGAASTRWSDWVGTGAADDAPVETMRPSLYETCGLDRNVWQIVGFDIEIVNGEMAASVFAFNRSTEHDEQSDDDHGLSNAEDVVADLGHLPVSEFLLDQRQSQSLLSDALGRVSLRLVGRSFRDDVLVVQPGLGEELAPIGE